MAIEILCGIQEGCRSPRVKGTFIPRIQAPSSRIQVLFTQAYISKENHFEKSNIRETTPLGQGNHVNQIHDSLQVKSWSPCGAVCQLEGAPVPKKGLR